MIVKSRVKIYVCAEINNPNDALIKFRENGGMSFEVASDRVEGKNYMLEVPEYQVWSITIDITN